MNPHKEANNTPEEEREAKAEEYLLKSAENQKKASKQLNETLKDTQNTFESLQKLAKKEDYSKVAQTINEVNNLLREAKKEVI